MPIAIAQRAIVAELAMHEAVTSQALCFVAMHVDEVSRIV
jgi:hypothetical protein